MKSLVTIFTIAGLSSASMLPAQPPPATNNTSHPKVILVELFTSEGCSSCPPADALLRQINETQTPSGQFIVGISEHVTYWNSLGWSDRFSSPIYTERQNAYSTSFGIESVYTPQMVVNGTEQFVGSDRQSLLKAIQREQGQAQPVDLRILSTSRTGNSLTVNFSVTSDATSRGADIMAALTDDSDQSSVLSGENNGRTLTHVGVARFLSRVAKLDPAPEQTIHIQIPASIRALDGHRLILFAQARETGRVLGGDSKKL